MACACGDKDCEYLALGYPYCRSCSEHHRPPECPVDEQGRSLSPFGTTWEAEDAAYHQRLASNRA